MPGLVKDDELDLYLVSCKAIFEARFEELKAMPSHPLNREVQLLLNYQKQLGIPHISQLT